METAVKVQPLTPEISANLTESDSGLLEHDGQKYVPALTANDLALARESGLPALIWPLSDLAAKDAYTLQPGVPPILPPVGTEGPFGTEADRRRAAVQALDPQRRLPKGLTAVQEVRRAIGFSRARRSFLMAAAAMNRSDYSRAIVGRYLAAAVPMTDPRIRAAAALDPDFTIPDFWEMLNPSMLTAASTLVRYNTFQGQDHHESPATVLREIEECLTEELEEVDTIMRDITAMTEVLRTKAGYLVD